MVFLNNIFNKRFPSPHSSVDKTNKLAATLSSPTKKQSTDTAKTNIIIASITRAQTLMTHHL